MGTTTEAFRVALRELKIANRAKIAEIAKAAGVSTRHIQGVLSEREKKGLGPSAQYQVASFFGMRVTDMLSIGERIMAGAETPTAMIDAEEARGNVKARHLLPDGTETAFYHDLPLNMVPLISWVQAGCFVNPCAQTTPGFAEEFTFYPGKVKPHMFALRVHNDSMEPEFREGDVVVVDPDRAVENGSFVVAKNGAHEATLKKFVRDGGKVYLRPLNRDYEPIEVTESEGIRIVGVVVFKGKMY